MKKTAQEPKVTENPLYHDTWMLLRKYRDVVWSLELSVQQVRRQFQIEYGSSIEEFLESLYVAGITFEGSAIEDYARCIERSYKMLNLLDTSVELLRTKHKYGESYYWLLYYTYLSPQQLANTQEIIDKLEPHIRDISYRTYFRKRQMAIDALSSVLWGYSSKESLARLEKFVPEGRIVKKIIAKFGERAIIKMVLAHRYLLRRGIAASVGKKLIIDIPIAQRKRYTASSGSVC